eukprot:SAG11_NODE_2645_length_3135_cov_2.456851_1_plen_350_part_00
MAATTRLHRLSRHLTATNVATGPTAGAHDGDYGLTASAISLTIERGMRFIADNTTAEGKYTLGVDDTHNNYKEIPLGYQAAGMPTDAARCLQFAWKTFIEPQGPEGAVPPAALQTENMVAYAPAWSVRSAVQHGRLDIASLLIPYILSFQKLPEGGFFGGRPGRASQRGVFCFDTSTVAIQAALWCGKLAAARAGGEYLLRLASLQPAGADRWYWMLDSEGALVTDCTDSAPFLASGGDYDFASGEPENFYHEKGKPNQYYYKTGLFVSQCVYLYDAFGDARYLDAAKQCMDWSLACHPDVTTTMLGHKMIWGAAEVRSTYRLAYLLTWGRPLLLASCCSVSALPRDQD